VLCPVDEKGHMTSEAPGFEGLFYDQANKPITEQLEEKGALLKLDFITHSYPHDWRTKKPTIFRATSQWFASIKDFRDELLDAVKETKWVPEWGETRLYNMIRDRGDWCISSQRAWGVPILRYFMPKMGSRSSRMKRSTTFLNYSGSTVRTFGLKKKRMNCFRKALRIREVRTASSQRNRTSWMSGLIQVRHIRPYWKSAMIL
jgi:isoleucyl-tRNA synthetase